MADRISFLHPPRDDFATTIRDAQRAVFGEHPAYLQGLLEQGSLTVAGRTGGTVNTPVAVFEAPDECSARSIMGADPAIACGIMRGERRPFRASLRRGRA